MIHSEYWLILCLPGIETSRVLKTASVSAILEEIDEDCLALDTLQSRSAFVLASPKLTFSTKGKRVQQLVDFSAPQKCVELC